MPTDEQPIKETPEDARQGENIRGMTTVLGVSITGVVVVLGLGLAAFVAFNAGWF